MFWLDLKEFIADVLKYVLIAAVVILIFLYIVSIQQVVGPSMHPTLENGDITVLSRVHYLFGDIKRNDIVSLDYADTKYLIKRVIGLPGEFIEFKDNVLYINGEGYRETNLPDNVVTEDFSLKDLGYNKIPEDMYLVLGDNRGDSLDSRKIGLIKKEDIKGKVVMRIFPFNKISFLS